MSRFFVLSVLLGLAPAATAQDLSCVSVALNHVSPESPETWAAQAVALPSGWTPLSISSTDSGTQLVACQNAGQLHTEWVYVTGGVREDGPIPFSPGLTVAQALTRAGGPSDNAQLKGARVVRDEAVTRVHLGRILNGDLADVPLQPNDRLVVRGW